ncbi:MULTISPECIES: FkbM family methyltransferase [Nostocales]|uniref:FkbM family methyltransferase n=3 Tax=Nostocales TaxID=1161 RepID=A0A8S9T062_9CYAN|nr:FkbM family methyltransferase [Tolypothrix bouteillei]KAF3885417.1 FkbM family methyltransferase [Tolypothrix bouteillei VB521301]
MSEKKMTSPSGLEYYYVSSQEETQYIYSEIFTEQQYIGHNIVINEGDCIFDVGANIGLFSLYVSTIQEKLKIYAFEPIPETFAVLEKNKQLHSLDNLFVFNYGLSSENNLEKAFTFYPDMAGNSTTRPGEILVEQESFPSEIRIEDLFKDFFQDEKKIKCEVKTLSSVISELGISSIELLKIDVEGEEYEVLKGIEDSDWSKIKQIIAEVHDKNGRIEKVKKMLTSHGFNIELRKRELLPSTYVDTFNLYAKR